jgi:hypothetical protein
LSPAHVVCLIDRVSPVSPLCGTVRWSASIQSWRLPRHRRARFVSAEARPEASSTISVARCSNACSTAPTTDEVFVVIAGQLRVEGREGCSGPGGVVFMPRDTPYAVSGGPEGVRYFRLVVS